MAQSFKIEFNGGNELQEVLEAMKNDFGEKDARRILVSAVRESMKPVLAMSKGLVAKDTGALEASLRIEARRPSNKDKKSKYVSQSDTVIATVTIAPPSVLAKKKFFNLRSKLQSSAFNKKGIKQIGIEADFRGIANEFGTADMDAKPYLRPALESQSKNVVDNLFSSLLIVLERYKARQARKTK